MFAEIDGIILELILLFFFLLFFKSHRLSAVSNAEVIGRQSQVSQDTFGKAGLLFMSLIPGR